MGDTANFTEYIKYLHKIRDPHRFRYDRSMGDYKAWAAGVRKTLAPHFAVCDDGYALNPKLLWREEKDGYTQETVEISINGYLRLRGKVLVPASGSAPYPAVLCLAGHGWQYYYDLDKTIDNGHEKDPMMDETRRLRFDYRIYPAELVRRGYIVFVFETFYFGNYNLDVDNVPQLFKDEFGVDPAKYPRGSEEYKAAYNLFVRRFEAYMYKYLAFAGVTWSGLLLDEDKKCLDYICSRDDVDKNRVGCVGLSLGGFRTMILTAMDARLKCSVIVGWMCSQADMLEEGARYHTFMMFQGSLWDKIDFPDLAALNAPAALLVQNGLRDEQFFGVEKAFARMQKIYDEAGCPDQYCGKIYDAIHCFNSQMQDDAYAFMEKHLKNL